MSVERFVYQHRVTYAECTVGNHVYYSRYLDLLEAARGAFFRKLGVSFSELQKQNLIFPVIEARLKYRAPARYDDVLNIEITPTAVHRVRLNFGYSVRNQDGKLLLEAETLHVCTTTDEKPVQLPSELAALLKSHIPEPLNPSVG